MRHPVTILLTAAAIATGCGPAHLKTEAGASSLGGSDWVLVELRGSPAVSGGAGAPAPHLRFDADSGRVSGSSGCNRVSGHLRVSGDSVAMGPLASTRMACLDDELNRQEAAFLAALEAARRYRVTGDTLRLLGDDGVLALLVATPD